MAVAPFYDRILQSTTTTGTGTLTLAGAITGYQSFAAVGNSNTTPMAIWEVDANGNPSGAWEVATECTYTASGTTLSRGTFQASSTGSAINFGAGTKRVAQALPAVVLNSLIFHRGPEGVLINGKIAVSVTASDLTVAIKGEDGNNPSASNPVYCRIDGVLRAITAALSVTKNDGTNWCNSGAAETATRELDYFVYLGYNATDGVVIGFSRIPYVRQYSEFSVTTTNEKYCAISIITNAAAGDYYNVVGRFAATLSAGAGYTWTVPSFGGINLIQRPIYSSRWLVYTPAMSSTTGTITTVGAISGVFKITEDVLFFDHTGTITTNGSGATGIRITLPFTPVGTQAVGTGRENAVTGALLQSRVGANYIEYFTAANAYPGGTGYQIIGGGMGLRLL